MDSREAAICFLGDICPGECDGVEYEGSFDSVSEVLDKADFRIANLECPIVDDDSTFPIRKTGPNLRAGGDCLSILKKLKLDLVTLANNHIGDFGEVGVVNTVRELENAGIVHVGAGADAAEAYAPFRRKINGLRFSIISVCENEFGISHEETAGAAGYLPEQMPGLVQHEKAVCDHVIVLFHGGSEYNPLPSPGTVARYRAIIDAGASAVVGTHPHCPQGYELYGNGIIVYSLGNFFFPDEKRADDSAWNKGYIAALHFSLAGVRLNIVPYCYHPKSRSIQVLHREKKEAFISYMKRLNALIADRRELQNYFNAWSIYRGEFYARHLSWNRDMGRQEKQRESLEILNLFRCETHREMMRTYFELHSKKRENCYGQYWDKLRNLFYVPIGTEIGEDGKMDDDLKYINSDEELCSIVRGEKEVLLYGAGKVAAEIWKTLPDECRKYVRGILVTAREDNKEKFHGVLIEGVAENHFDRKMLVIIAASGEKRQGEIIASLKENSFFNFMLPSRDFEDILLQRLERIEE